MQGVPYLRYALCMGFKTKWRRSPPELVALFDSVLPMGSGIERRTMFGYPCAFVNGNMFTGLHQENMIVRLGESDRQTLLEVPGASLFQPHGVGRMVMREYVAVPRSVLDDRAALGTWVMKAVAYASSLSPRNKL